MLLLMVGLVTGLLVAVPHSAVAQNLRTCSESSARDKNGTFSGLPKVELLRNGREVRLLESLRYVDPCGATWESPQGSVVDGASIPRVAWSIVGGPLEGAYRDASVIHDVACVEKTKVWELVHEAFYFGMLARGVEWWKAKVMYAAVYHFGPRWADPVTKTRPPRKKLRERDFQKLAESIQLRESATTLSDTPPMTLDDIESWMPPR